MVHDSRFAPGMVEHQSRRTRSLKKRNPENEFGQRLLVMVMCFKGIMCMSKLRQENLAPPHQPASQPTSHSFSRQNGEERGEGKKQWDWDKASDVRL